MTEKFALIKLSEEESSNDYILFSITKLAIGIIEDNSRSREIINEILSNGGEIFASGEDAFEKYPSEPPILLSDIIKNVKKSES